MQKVCLTTPRSNRFTYQESNLEGYIQYAQKWKHIQATAGMRVEYMQTIGTLESYLDGKLMEENKNNHTRLFPNLLSVMILTTKQSSHLPIVNGKTKQDTRP